MKQCLEEHYWDFLLQKCTPCEYRCKRPNHQNCDMFCKSLRCKKQGSYYDHLVKDCISCYSICGQHPKQCAHICQKGPLSHLEQELSGDPGQLALVYTVLGLCVCAAFCCFVITVACFLRRKGEQPPPGRLQDFTEDHLMEAGRVGDGSKELRTPEPVETCGFCFPEQTPPTEESAAPTEVSHPEENGAALREWLGPLGTASSGPPPGCKEGCLNIICSPSQEKAAPS
ncbi:tumor necrosis factor receptor superfamily member 13B [Gracilinanus agilis]|uniref:tumor necrosis factor receptor superfamily member 13B n=1 Tax=Gracilinanus agilis TaxID=191870 RepID=UPI001CFD0ABC|nr:tumor necrosis factor receptor superfamily member 13B [Gracilinanus agilis]